MNRAARRPFVALVLVVAAGAGWFGVLPALTMTGRSTLAAMPPSNPGMAASPAASTEPSAEPSGPPGSPFPTPLATPTPTPLPVTIEARRAALSATLLRLRAAYGMPGVSAAMTFPDGTSWVATSGFADLAHHRRLTAQTAFAAGSISKTFTGALVMALAEEGRLSLDATVKSYLPTLGIDPAITVRELLDHTSGLDDFFMHTAIDKALMADRARVWTTADSLRYVGKPYFKPGTGWHYSNTNYLVLGMLAEVVGGAPLPEQLRQRFFDPLGLTRTIYQYAEPPRGPLARGYRFTGPGRRLKGIDVSDGTAIVPFTSVVTAAGSAGSIATTARDLATWARALYGGLVLRPETIAAMVDDAAVSRLFKATTPYGLGVQVVTIDGRPTLGHSGRLLGSQGVMRWLPNEGIAVVVLTNQSRTNPDPLIRDLLRTVLGPPPAPPCPCPMP